MKRKILIVDDNQGDRLLIKEAVQSAGLDIEMHMAESGEECLKIIEGLKENLIVILDTLMPTMNGFELCKKIRKIDEKVKIIICTGFVDAVDAGKARASGADDYCVKTSDYEPLIKAIKNVITME